MSDVEEPLHRYATGNHRELSANSRVFSRITPAYPRIHPRTLANSRELSRICSRTLAYSSRTFANSRVFPAYLRNGPALTPLVSTASAQWRVGGGQCVRANTAAPAWVPNFRCMMAALAGRSYISCYDRREPAWSLGGCAVRCDAVGPPPSPDNRMDHLDTRAGTSYECMDSGYLFMAA